MKMNDQRWEPWRDIVNCGYSEIKSVLDDTNPKYRKLVALVLSCAKWSLYSIRLEMSNNCAVCIMTGAARGNSFDAYLCNNSCPLYEVDPCLRAYGTYDLFCMYGLVRDQKKMFHTLWKLYAKEYKKLFLE